MKVVTKNVLLRVILLIIGIAFILTGCATVSDVTNKDGSKVYFDDLQYFEGQIAVIGDYIYFGNSFTASGSEDFDYDLAADTGYLARINVSQNLVYNRDEDEDGYVNPSPEGVEIVVKDRLIGYQNQNMFALGEYLYFTSANTHRTSSLENDYTMVSLFRVKFNGDKLQEIDTFRYDENSIITVQKGSDDNYYYIIYAPTTSEAESYNLYSIRIGNRIGETTTLVEDANSVAVCDENSTIKNVVYTIDSDRTEQETTAVRAIDFATGENDESYENNNDVVRTQTTLLGRVGDIVIYSYTNQNTVQEIYYKDLVNDDKYFSGARKFYDAKEISSIKQVGDGYIFIPDRNSSVMYKSSLNSSQEPVNILTSSDYKDILFVDGDYIYYSNLTSISRKSVRTSQSQTLVTMTDIQSGQCGYDGEYIYFYAKLESNEDSEDSETTSTDENYYMFRVDKTGENIELLSKVEKPQ